MGKLKNRKLLVISLFVVLLTFAVMIFMFDDLYQTAYTNENKKNYNYTINDIREILGASNTFNEESQYLTAYSQDGTMTDIKVDTNSAPIMQSQIIPLSSSFNVQTLVGFGRTDSQSIVLTIMGDGFTSTQQSRFIMAAQNIANEQIKIENFHPI